MEAFAAETTFLEPGADRQLDPERSSRHLDALSARLDRHIPGLGEHCRRVGRYAAGMARELALAPAEVERVRRAGLLHDIGKLETPAAIVNKCGSLTVAEFAIVQRHASAGGQLVARLGDPGLTAIVRHHHERYDGAGYPAGLAGQEIPLGARIVAVADTFDAVTTVRPYRPAQGCGEALELLDAAAGTQLDPNVVAAFRAFRSSPRGLLLRALGR